MIETALRKKWKDFKHVWGFDQFVDPWFEPKYERIFIHNIDDVFIQKLYMPFYWENYQVIVKYQNVFLK